MKHISNEEKAIELAENISPYDIGGDNAAHYAAKDAALEAMEWKDEEHAKEKQQWIEKVTNFINEHFYLNINNKAISKKEYFSFTELIRDLNKYIEQ